MSSQNGSGIAFCLRSEESQDHFRLLELPPELLQLVTSANPPVLQFKSAASTASLAAGAGAVICTPDKTYNIRQVNTSNSVYICQPVQQAADDGDGGLTSPRLQAVAKCGFTLELSHHSNASAGSYLKAALPLYSPIEASSSREPRSKQMVFDDIPLSQAECEQAWTDLACFETVEPINCFLPSAGAKIAAWHAILRQATAQDIDLTMPISGEHLARSVDNDEDWPQELSHALLRSLSGTSEGHILLDEARTLRNIGVDSLAALSQARGSVALSDWLDAWRDLMPERWREKVSQKLLPPDSWKTLSNGSVALNADGASSTNADLGSSAPRAKSTLGAKRKWHDKFRASKKAA
ncbi:hypothetical protein BAUCODRAFT_299017 [Baudoinia panamericana UAMH 10762]|uniref:Sister chromatid cohesion protein Dcc1 n=1 Tax=Baudoinia panamericana (strain UAMH 10762) TaxID=717646 RepID=M2LCE0_BAUPA|nr:uncharacterized protein BAUCODRAFT_299017 [Baudoinia panamericana UAMH 10762]EMC91612.1 hypothetical protein BAUCODRAFT_299017 [Baudoinia panamericana UAMH 10762]